MSPEAIDPEKSRFSKKSDAWSFAVVCWEIMTNGKTPFENMNAMEAGTPPYIEVFFFLYLIFPFLKT